MTTEAVAFSLIPMFTWRSVSQSVLILLAVACQSSGALEQDGAVQDAAVQDAAVQDAAIQDAAVQDAAVQDATTSEAGTMDDGAVGDAGTMSDASASMPDGMVAAPDAGVAPIDPTGPGPHTTRDSETSLRNAGREIPITVHRPDAVMSPPVVILLPGFLLEASYYRSLAIRIASHGFTVIQADPPNSLLRVNHVRMREDVVAVMDWAETMGFVSSRTRIAVAGHSLGGKVASMVAAVDARVQALFAIDPVNGDHPITGYSSALPDIVPDPVSTISVPAGILGETVNATGGSFGMACAPRDQNFQTFYEAMTATPWIAEWDVVGADHMDFLSDPEECGFTCSQCTSGSADPAQVVSSTMTLMVAFFRQHLLGESMTTYLTGPRVPAGITTRSR